MVILIMAIRKAISGVQEPPIPEILETNIMTMLSQLFKFNDTSEEIRIMKLEALWILTNLAYGTTNDINFILQPQFELRNVLNLILSSNDRSMIEQALWFIGNITGENDTYKEIIINNTCILQTFERLISQPKISKTLLRTVCWVNSNLTRYKDNSRD